MSSSILMVESPQLQNWLKESLQQQDRNQSDWLEKLRQQGVELVTKSRLPDKNDEEWRFTPLDKLSSYNFTAASKVDITAETLQSFSCPEIKHSLLVFVNGYYNPNLSDVSALPSGVYVGNISGISEEKLAQYLGNKADNQEIFTALNTVGLNDLAVIWLDKNVVVDTPIHILYLSVPETEPSFCHPRTLVVAETSSSVQLVEHYGVVADNCSDVNQNLPYFTNAVTEIYLSENAQVHHTRIQQESGNSFHIANSAIAQSRDSRYTYYEVNLGGKLSRHNLAIHQLGEQTETHLYGLTMIQQQQLSDTHSLVSLTQPGGTVNQIHKCIIDDQSRAVFNGKILVPQAAQLTNAAQLNRNLVLSSQARVNTKPELQITADNVKCTHGATVSQLEADELFYLRSRGLDETSARNLLIDAFAAEILADIPVKSLRNRLSQCVACKTSI